MNLAAIDQVTTRVAQAVYACAPNIDWREVISTVVIPPHGQSMQLDWAFVLTSGLMERGLEPTAIGYESLQEAARAHWQLTQDLGQPRWFAMTVRVSRSGKFSTELEYNDNYQEGDMFKPRPDPVPSPQ
jgi:hypothetical protein